MLGADGAHGVSHPKVDKKAGVPAGTTSFYFRTRKALLEAIAARMNEFDIADLSLMSELTDAESTEFAGTAGLANIVMYSATEPWLTRSKARYELALHASRDTELAAELALSVERLYGLVRQVVTQWHEGDEAPDPAVLDNQTVALLSLINGVMMGFVVSRPLVDSAEHLDLLIQGVLDGVGRAGTERRVSG